jgi:hypothetical protein
MVSFSILGRHWVWIYAVHVGGLIGHLPRVLVNEAHLGGIKAVALFFTEALRAGKIASVGSQKQSVATRDDPGPAWHHVPIMI